MPALPCSPATPVVAATSGRTSAAAGAGDSVEVTLLVHRPRPVPLGYVGVLRPDGTGVVLAHEPDPPGASASGRQRTGAGNLRPVTRTAGDPGPVADALSAVVGDPATVSVIAFVLDRFATHHPRPAGAQPGTLATQAEAAVSVAATCFPALTALHRLLEPTGADHSAARLPAQDGLDERSIAGVRRELVRLGLPPHPPEAVDRTGAERGEAPQMPTAAGTMTHMPPRAQADLAAPAPQHPARRTTSGPAPTGGVGMPSGRVGELEVR